MVYLDGVNEFPLDAEQNAVSPGAADSSMKRATIVDQEDDAYGVEYDNTVGTRNTMRLEATTYEDAILEAKSYLGIIGERDEHGTVWEID